MKTVITIGVMALVLGTHIIIGDADIPPVPLTQQEIVAVEAAAYHAPFAELMNVGHCESGIEGQYFNQNAIGKAGEIGAFQYFQSTWNFMTSKMGQKLDIHSFSDQARLTAWVFSVHPEWKKQWSTWRVYYGNGKHVCRIIKA